MSEKSAGDIIDNPVNSLKKSISCPCAAANDTPVPSRNIIELEELFDLITCETSLDILFVAENKQSGSHQSLLFQQIVKFSLRVFKSHLVWTVDNPDHSIGLLEVVSPIWTDGFLTSNIPNVQFKGFILQSFDIESQSGWDLINVFPIELFDNGCFTCVVQTQN